MVTTVAVMIEKFVTCGNPNAQSAPFFFGVALSQVRGLRHDQD